VGLVSASSAGAGDATVESGAAARASRVEAGEPWLDRSVVGKAHNQVLVAFKVAMELVTQSPSCNALFSELGADGDEIVVGGVFLTFRRDQSASTTEALGHG
jgi:hypothetical protein